ncbi:hypothetical protein BHE74_00015783 [Ensete ventricosum]|nr:hypothetical protein GW17_00010302 [Ensete ventricosum]RWW76148.1 hypothetical protein BHE74_00015783 [Ensete ventricosum]RZR90517.1 hypothetical protein BHM03_00018409 [Ensete ventricosum]
MELSGDSTRSEPMTSNAAWWHSDIAENLKSVSLAPRGETLTTGEFPCDVWQAEYSSQAASQILWSTGTFSGLIPNGFYSIIPDKKLKELFDTIPSPDGLYSLGMEGSKADIILVDAEKDKKLSMLKQLNLSPAKAAVEDVSRLMDTRGIQLLGQIRQGSCRPRAILFKVLADAVGLESKLVVVVIISIMSGISNLIALYRRSVRFDFNHCRPLPGGINLVTARLAATREEARKKKEKEGEPRTTPPSNDEASPKAGDVYD